MKHHPYMKPTLRRRLAPALLTGLAFSLALLGSCGLKKRNSVIISVQDQQMLLVNKGKPVKTYPVSTSKFGIGNRRGSRCRRPLRRRLQKPQTHRGNPQAERTRARPHRKPHPLAARQGAQQPQHLPPLHLHPRYPGGIPHRPQGQLRLHPHEIPRRHRPLPPPRRRLQSPHHPRLALQHPRRPSLRRPQRRIPPRRRKLNPGQSTSPGILEKTAHFPHHQA